MSTFTIDTTYVEVDCGHESHGPGGFTFAMTQTFYDETRRTGRAWYCPLGHCRCWKGKSTEQQLKDANARETALQDQLTAAIREGETSRSELLRIRSRIANGVCPCCNRSFENVRRHIADQHPDFVPPKQPQHRAVRFRCSCGSVFTTYRGLRVHQGHQRMTKGAFRWDKPGVSRYLAHLTEGADR